MKWNINTITIEAEKYTARTFFLKGARGAYAAAKKLGVFEDVTKHMKPNKTAKIWNKESVTAEALKYKSRSEFCENNRTAYNICARLNIMDKVTAHMDVKETWTVIRLAIEAKKYTTATEFKTENLTAYQIASNQGILKAITKHFTRWKKQT